ncbi:MAG: hypothetical protein ABR584_00905 [Candidatus Baltobacteraceae bacterium]
MRAYGEKIRCAVKRAEPVACVELIRTMMVLFAVRCGLGRIDPSFLSTVRLSLAQTGQNSYPLCRSGDGRAARAQTAPSTMTRHDIAAAGPSIAPAGSGRQDVFLPG